MADVGHPKATSKVKTILNYSIKLWKTNETELSFAKFGRVDAGSLGFYRVIARVFPSFHILRIFPPILVLTV